MLLRTIIAALSLILIPVFCLVDLHFVSVAFAQKPFQEPVRVNVIIPLTGDGSSYGDAMRKAIELALVDPSDSSKLKVVFDDDGLQPATTAKLFQKALTIDRAQAVLVFGSASGNAVASIAESNKIPTIAIAASDFNVVKGRRYVFSHWVTPQAEAIKLVAHLKKLGRSKIGLLQAEQDGMNAFAHSLKEELSKASMDQLKLHLSYNPQDKDLRNAIVKAKAADLDTLIIALYPGQIGTFYRQAKQQDLKAELVGWETVEDSNEVKASEGAMVGSWYVGVADPAQDFSLRFQERFKVAPGIVSANTYDTIKILIAAIDENKVKKSSENTTMAEQIVDYLKELKNFKGAAGTYSASGDNRFLVPAAIKRIEQDSFKAIE